MTKEWIYPNGFESPQPAPRGYRLVVELYHFMGLEKRWRYEKLSS